VSLEPSGQEQRRPDSPETEASPSCPSHELDDAALQEKYREQYLLQLRRQSCPGCGESPFDPGTI
jgi:hypothetical protein